jgi:hypothetical protein
MSPAATAAAEPPLEPPGDSSGLHGFRVRPNSAGSVAQMVAELRRIGAPADDESRGQVTLDGPRRLRGHVIAQGTRAHAFGDACLGLAQVLEQKRHARQGSVAQRTRRLGSCSLELLVHEHVQLTLLLQPSDRGVHELERRELAAADQRRLFGDVLDHELRGQGASLYGELLVCVLVLGLIVSVIPTRAAVRSRA